MSAQDSEDGSRALDDRDVALARCEWSGFAGEASARRNRANTAAVVHDLTVEDWIASVSVSAESLQSALDSHDGENATIIRTGRDLVAVVSEDEREVVAGDPGGTGRVAVDAVAAWLAETDAGMVQVVMSHDAVLVASDESGVVSML